MSNFIQVAKITGNTLGLGNPGPGTIALPVLSQIGDAFGYSVKINDFGNRVFVAAPWADTNNIDGVGAVYVFTGNGSNWYQTARITGNPFYGSSQRMGLSLSIDASGNTIAVGAPLADVNGINNAGAVYIFTGDGNNYNQTNILTGENLGSNLLLIHCTRQIQFTALISSSDKYKNREK